MDTTRTAMVTITWERSMVSIAAFEANRVDCATAYKMADHGSTSDSSGDEDYAPEGRV